MSETANFNIEQVREHYRHHAGYSENFPFDQHVLCLRLYQKIFLLCDLSKEPLSINLKCDPMYALVLRQQHPEAIVPGYHMNKKHWNTVYPAILSQSNGQLVPDLIEHSYQLVLKSVPKSKRFDMI